MNKNPRTGTVITVAALACTAAFAQTDRPAARNDYSRTLAAERSRHAGGAGSTKTNPLIDHGGTVLPASRTVAIYWGPVGDFPVDLQSGMASLLSGFNGSKYLDIAQQYMRKAPISTSYGGSIPDSSTPPSKAPTTADIAAEVCKLVPNPDPNTIYFVFTSNAPNISYCAWHDKATCNGVTFQVAYVPNQALLAGCSPYVKTNLGCNTLSEGTAASADSVAHEFMEAITDAHIDEWYDKTGEEVADKCNFVYQSCVKLPPVSWQIQTEWSNALNACQQQ